MGTFERLQNYSPDKKVGSTISSSVKKSKTTGVELFYDISTPQGFLLNRLHEEGYKIVDTVYTQKDGTVLSKDEYNKLSVEEQADITKSLAKTELCNMITSESDTLTVSCAGSGKALKNGTGVYTDKGFVGIECLNVGDSVYGLDGRLHSVVGVFPQGEKEIYEVSFSDGNTIECSGDHLWSVEVVDKADLDGNSTEFVLSTEDLSRLLHEGNKKCFVECCSPIDSFDNSTMEFKNLSIPYYLLGVLLSGNVSIISDKYFRLSDDVDSVKILSYISKSLEGTGLYLDKVSGLSYDGDFYEIKSLHPSSDVAKEVLSVLNRFLAVDEVVLSVLLYNIFVGASAINRQEFIEGLSDTNKVDRYDTELSVTVKSVPLAEALVWVCESAGKIASFDINEDLEVEVRVLLKANYRQIVDVVNTGAVDKCTCIQVDSVDHLYLTEHFIPTHNTTALIFKIMYDIVTGEATKLTSVPNGNSVRVLDSIFVGTFLKSGADELKSRLNAWQRKLGYMPTADRINFGTLHAEFKRALNAMGVATPIAKDSDIRKFIRKSADGLGINKKGFALSNEDYYAIGGIITYYRNRLDDNRYNHPSCEEYDITPAMLDSLVQSYQMEKQSEGVMDFEDLQDLLYKYLYLAPNKAVQDFISSRYSYIYLDEFQDTSQVQYAILRFYARGRLSFNKAIGNTLTDEQSKGYFKDLYTGVPSRGKFVAIGDEDQCIYGWRGSDIDIICNDFLKDFSPNICKLSINYRCPSEILTPIAKSIEKNTIRLDKTLKSFRSGGDFNAYSFANVKGMLSKLSEDIDADYRSGRSVAIICRTNFDGMIPALMLELEHKFDFSISSDAMTLSSPLPKRILSVASIFTERNSLSVRNALLLICSKAGRYARMDIDSLIQTLRNDDTKGYRNSIWNMDIRDLDHSCPCLCDFVETIKPHILNDRGERDSKKEVEGLALTYYWLLSSVFTSRDSAYEQSARAYIETLLYLLSVKDFNSVSEFLDEVETYNEHLKSRIRKSNVPIEIVTVHEFKGKERDSIYVWNDSEGVFPSNKTDLDNLGQVEEERRVHYIACTRARKSCSIYALQGKESMFLKEMGVTCVNPLKISGALSDGASSDEGTANIDIMKVLEGVEFDDTIPNV